MEKEIIIGIFSDPLVRFKYVRYNILICKITIIIVLCKTQHLYSFHRLKTGNFFSTYLFLQHYS
mgnify:CR=1 FL=1